MVSPFAMAPTLPDPSVQSRVLVDSDVVYHQV